MDALLKSFQDSAYLVDIVRPRQTIPSVLYIPKSGEGAWYVPTFGILFVSPIKPLWTGNTFEFEWPPRSGRMIEIPEVDRAEWFTLEAAREKLNPAQAELLDRLTGLDP